MHDDDLKQQLQRAETDLAPAKLSPGAFAARVRAADRRRRKRRVILAAVAPLAFLAAFVVGRVLPEQQYVTTVAKPDTALEAQLLALEAEAETHAARARALIAEREARLRLEADDPLAELRENVDIVAYRMILEADELQADMRPSTEAVEIYERVIRDFPNTYSAEVAQERLASTDSPGAKS